MAEPSSPSRPYSTSDPVWVFISERLPFPRDVASPIVLGLYAIAFQLIANVFYTLFFHWYSKTPAGTWGALVAPHTEGTPLTVATTLFFTFVLTPAVWAAYAWIPDACETAFRSLATRRVLVGTSEQLAALLDPSGAVGRVFFLRRWVYLSAGITLILAVLFATGVGFGPLADARLQGLSGDRLSDVRRFVSFNLATWCLGWYMVCQIVARHLSMFLGLRALFANCTITLHPLHPDGAGGLGPLGSYSIRFAYLLALFSVTAVFLTLLTANVNAQGESLSVVVMPSAFGVACFCLAALPIAFFGPVSVAHQPMRDARDGMLARISERFMLDYSALQERLGSTTEEVRSHRERIEELTKLYDMAREFPVWPFDRANIRRFAALLTTPLLPIVLAGFQKAAGALIRILI